MLSTRGVSPITGTGSHAADYVSSLFAAGTPASRGFAAVCVGDWRIKMMMLMGLFIERYRCWQLQNQTRVITRKISQRLGGWGGGVDPVSLTPRLDSERPRGGGEQV